MTLSAAVLPQRATASRNRHARMFPSYRRLSPPAYLVLGTLREFIFDEESRTVDYSWLVDETGLSYSMVSRAVKEITAAGFIARERAHSGRGHSYRITMLRPPEHADATQPAHFFARQTMPEGSTNHALMHGYQTNGLGTGTPQTADFHTPIMLSSSHEQHEDDGDNNLLADDQGCVAPPTTLVVPPTDFTPSQQALFALLHAHNAGLVAERIVRQRPDLTCADLAHDLALAQARPGIERPIGLVCAAWLNGGRVYPARAVPADAAGVSGSPPVPVSETENYLLQQGFSAKVAHEFRALSLVAVQQQVTDVFSRLDTAHERNQKIGRLVVRWRRVPPTVAPVAAAVDQPASVSVTDEQPTATVDTATLHAGMAAYGYLCTEQGIYLCDPVSPDELAALWQEQHPVPPTSEPSAARALPATPTPVVATASDPPPHDPERERLTDLWQQVRVALGDTGNGTADGAGDILAAVWLHTLAGGRALLGCHDRAQRARLEAEHVPAIRHALSDVLGYAVQVYCRVLSADGEP